ncbi:NAD(P)-dependent alcohol dehydrogenase [Aspergillus stella-maris]|uniref:NAD(P)-dependent alcohol dehydrogenase n=1 Tax=Aspergillus stella-maris TaxID=1810926 RepID=UPI003CCCA358
MPYPAEALVVHARGELPRLTPVILDDPRHDELLVEIHATGICHTDIACMEGTLPAEFPAVLGHEGAGIVLRASPTSDIVPGDKVILSYNFCRTCAQCVSGHLAYCENILPLNFGGTRADADASRTITLPSTEATAPAAETAPPIFANFFGQSSLARVALVQRSSVVGVPSSTNLSRFAPLGCGVQTGAGAVLNTLDIPACNGSGSGHNSKASIAIFGAGAVGLSAIMAARLRGAEPIIAIDLQESRLAMAREMGATHVVDGAAGGGGAAVVQRIREICAAAGAAGGGVQYAVDCTGSTAVIETMLNSLGLRGRAASVGAPPPGRRAGVDVFAHLVGGKQYLGCHQGGSVAGKMIPYLIEQNQAGKFPLEKMIQYYGAEDHERAFEDLKRGRAIKAVLVWKGGLN